MRSQLLVMASSHDGSNTEQHGAATSNNEEADFLDILGRRFLLHSDLHNDNNITEGLEHTTRSHNHQRIKGQEQLGISGQCYLWVSSNAGSVACFKASRGADQVKTKCRWCLCVWGAGSRGRQVADRWFVERAADPGR